MLLGLGLSVYAMVRMVKASRRKDNVGFQQAQRLRMASSLGAVMSLLVGYGYKNQDRVARDWVEIRKRYGF